MIAGLDYSTGDGVVCMDADLQHPPECLPRIIRAFEEGNEVISMVRTRNKSAGLIKNITSSGFYWLINCISDVHFEPNASDFFAVSPFGGRGFKRELPGKGAFPAGLCPERGLSENYSGI